MASTFSLKYTVGEVEVTRTFRSASREQVAARGQLHPRTTEQAVNGSTIVTNGPVAYRFHVLVLKFTGDETASEGTYNDLLTVHALNDFTFYDWEHVDITNEIYYNCTFLNDQIYPEHLGTQFFPCLVPVVIQEAITIVPA